MKSTPVTSLAITTDPREVAAWQLDCKDMFIYVRAPLLTLPVPSHSNKTRLGVSSGGFQVAPNTAHIYGKPIFVNFLAAIERTRRRKQEDNK